MIGSSLAPKWPIVVSFYGIHHQKSIFLLILAPFLPEAVEPNRCYFFENWVKKLKCPHLLKPLGTIFQHNYWSFYTSEPFTLARFNMRHPVEGSKVIFWLSLWYNSKIRPSMWRDVNKEYLPHPTYMYLGGPCNTRGFNKQISRRSTSATGTTVYITSYREYI